MHAQGLWRDENRDFALIHLFSEWQMSGLSASNGTDIDFASFEDRSSPWTCVHSCQIYVSVRKECSAGKTLILKTSQLHFWPWRCFLFLELSSSSNLQEQTNGFCCYKFHHQLQSIHKSDLQRSYNPTRKMSSFVSTDVLWVRTDVLQGTVKHCFKLRTFLCPVTVDHQTRSDKTI